MSYATATLGMLALRNQVKLPARRIGNLDIDESDVATYSDNLQYAFLLPSTLNTMADCMMKVGKAIEEDDDDSYGRNRAILPDLVRIVPDKHNIYLSTMNIEENDLLTIDSRRDIYTREWADMVTAKREFAYWGAGHISFDDDVDGLWEVWDAVQDFPMVKGFDSEHSVSSAIGNQNVKNLSGTIHGNVGHRTPGGPASSQTSHGVPSAAANTVTPNNINGIAQNTAVNNTSSSSTDGSLSRIKNIVRMLKGTSPR